MARQYEGLLTAIDRAQAMIEFSLDGRILSANDNFLGATGYTRAEVVGKHHRMFCDPEHAESAEYAQFWERLNEGAFESGEYKRVRKDGTPLWLQATYNPILDADGMPLKVVKFASDITEAKLRNAEYLGKVSAIDRAQAVIEFSLDGRILSANDNFLEVTGYRLAEVQWASNHRMFCDPEHAESAEYAQFWERLNEGAFESGEYKRVRKDGTPLWLQATYNPILDADGMPLKVVKFASDITEAKLRNAEIEARLDAVGRAPGCHRVRPRGLRPGRQRELPPGHGLLVP